MAQISLHGGGSPEAMKREIWRNYPVMEKAELVEGLLDRGILDEGREPLVGSATSGGMMTTCRREADSWILNGQKKWIGNATFADINVIWAREEGSNQVKGFVVGKDNPGFSVEKIKTKMALRVVQNGLITLKDCRVAEADRLQDANSFKDTAKVLRMTRTGGGLVRRGLPDGSI
jgi:alkylation response protein AidB-like acyl-CoA dehydrogenase